MPDIACAWRSGVGLWISCLFTMARRLPSLLKKSMSGCLGASLSIPCHPLDGPWSFDPPRTCPHLHHTCARLRDTIAGIRDKSEFARGYVSPREAINLLSPYPFFPFLLQPREQMSLGFLTESALLPSKAKPIDVDGRSQICECSMGRMGKEGNGHRIIEARERDSPRLLRSKHLRFRCVTSP